VKVLSYMVEAHIFREKDNKMEFLLLKRAEKEIYSGVWQMVTGSMDHTEKAAETVLREIREETGLIPEKLWVVPYVNSFYSRRRNHICMVPVFAAQVNYDSKVKISDEHSDFQWLGKEDAIKLLAWQGQRVSVNTIYEYFTNDLSFFNFELIDLAKISGSKKNNK